MPSHNAPIMLIDKIRELISRAETQWIILFTLLIVLGLSTISDIVQISAIKIGLYCATLLLSILFLHLFQHWHRLIQAEHERQKQALIDNERFIRIIADNMPGMLSYWTNQLRCSFANRTYFEWFGLQPETIIGMSSQDLLGAEAFAENEPFLRKALQGEAQQFERKLIKFDGSTRHVWIQYIPDRVGEKVQGVFVMKSDITEVKQTQFDCERSNRTLQAINASNWALMQASDEASYLHEICRLIVEDCGYYMAWVGFAEQDAEQSIQVAAQVGVEEGYLNKLNLTWADSERGRGPAGTAIRTGQTIICKHTETDPNMQPWREEVLRHGVKSSVSLPMRIDGKVIGALSIYSRQTDRFFDAEVAMLQNFAKDLGYGLGVLRLRGEHARQEVALLSSEARFRLLASATFEGVVITKQGVILDCNEQLQRMIDTNHEALIGKPITDFIPIEDIDRVLENIMSGDESSIEHNLIRMDGSRIQVEAHGKSLESDERSIRITALRDITERKQAEQALLKLNNELKARTIEAEAASATKTLFLSNVSHELRTPLHTILGYSRILVNETHDGIRRKLEIIERNANHLQALIEDLLDFNLGIKNVRALVSNTVNLRELSEELELSVQLMAARHGNRFSVMLAEDVPAAVLVDENRLTQVLQNLISNACKYTRNGMVTLTISRAEHSTESSDEDQCRLRFAIEDNGVGIAGEDQERIFNAFNRGTTSFGQPGLGLGLTIAQQWVKAMGGNIELESELGRGSRFYFTLTLPSAPLLYEVAFECAAFRNKRTTPLRTVLVVDDIAETRLFLKELCENWGYRVLEAIDGRSAIATCMTANPPIDAMLVDQYMPGMDGWEVLNRVRQNYGLAHLPMVLISASNAQRPATLPNNINFDLLLGKPFDEKELACFLCQRLSLVDRTPESCNRFVSTIDTLPSVSLPSEELDNFRRMLSLGMVVRIETWAQRLAEDDPAYQEFAERVVQYCQSANLVALEKLGNTALSR